MRRSKVLLAPLQKQALYLMTGVLWMTGAIWLYFLETNPLRPLWMKIHGAAAMLFLIILGTLLVDHVPEGWKQKRQRPSGISLISFCSILMATGWGLYYVGDDTSRRGISLTHTVLGLSLPLILFVHIRMNQTR